MFVEITTSIIRCPKCSAIWLMRSSTLGDEYVVPCDHAEEDGIDFEMLSEHFHIEDWSGSLETQSNDQGPKVWTNWYWGDSTKAAY